MCSCGKEHTADEQFFVSVQQSEDFFTLLAGPYDTHEKALADVDRVWIVAQATWPTETAFCSVGTVGAPKTYPYVGRLNKMGLV